jgi:hypothetical protein
MSISKVKKNEKNLSFFGSFDGFGGAVFVL